ncbi:MAG: NAD-dependent deacylase [Ignavibacteriaceae bacterium]
MIQIDKGLIDRLTESESIVFFTGAGISSESGIPTFRGKDGIWNKLQNHFKDVSVITQNIDNLHRRAGSKKIYELHGNIERHFCINCKKFYNEEPDFSKGVPKCECGGLIRPDVVWFGEYLPEDQFFGGEKAAITSDVFFVVGTSAVVYPAAGLVYTAKQSGSTIVEINIEETPLTSIADYSYFGKAGEILPVIFEELKLRTNA